MLNITISIRKEQNENDRCDSIQILRVLTKLKMPKYYGYFSLWRKGDKEGFSPELDFGFSYSDLFRISDFDIRIYFGKAFATISATSSTWTLLSTPLSLSPSVNIVMQ